MRALTDFLLRELLALLSDAPPADAYASEESESQSQSQPSHVILAQQPRVMMVRSVTVAEQMLSVVDRHLAIDAFLPQQVVTELAASRELEGGRKTLAGLRGSTIRIDKYHFSTPERCFAMESVVRAKRPFSLASTAKAYARICLWVGKVTVIHASELAVNPCADANEHAQVADLLRGLTDDQLHSRLMTRQGLPLAPADPKDSIAEQFDNDHPLLDEDCRIPEDQEAQLDAQEGWGAPHNGKQPSDSQLIAENGSEPWSQSQSSLDVELAALSQSAIGNHLSAALWGAAPRRVEATEASQEDEEEESEVVPDSQAGFHFQSENIQTTFVQCSDSESESESSSVDEEPRTLSQADPACRVSAAKSNEAAASDGGDVMTQGNHANHGTVQITDLTGDDAEELSSLRVEGRLHGSNGNSPIDPDEALTQWSQAPKNGANGDVGKVIALDESDDDDEPLTQLPDSFDGNLVSMPRPESPHSQSQAGIEIHSQSAYGPVEPCTQAPDSFPDTQESRAEYSGESPSQQNDEEGESCPAAMDVDEMWHTQPTDDARMLDDSQTDSIGDESEQQRTGDSRRVAEEESMSAQDVAEGCADSQPAEPPVPKEASEPQAAMKGSSLVRRATELSTNVLSPASKESPRRTPKRDQKRPLDASSENVQSAELSPQIPQIANHLDKRGADVSGRKSLGSVRGRRTLLDGPIIPDTPESRPTPQHKQAAVPAIPLSIQRRTQEQHLGRQDTSEPTAARTSTVLLTRPHSVSSSRKRRSAGSSPSELRASKRFAHLFPPLHMESLKKLLVAQTKTK